MTRVLAAVKIVPQALGAAQEFGNVDQNCRFRRRSAVCDLNRRCAPGLEQKHPLRSPDRVRLCHPDGNQRTLGTAHPGLALRGPISASQHLDEVSGRKAIGTQLG